MRYLIIGGGVAGTTAAEELLKRDQSAEITILSEEHHPLYSRVLLPHYIKGKIPRERVFLKRENWYGEQGIERLAGVMAAHLDPKNKYVGASDGREYPYDKLLIATGGEVRPLDEDRRGVSYLRTLDDADHFLQLVVEQGDRARGVIYGGGFIACEYLNLFAHFRIPTVLVHRSEHFWMRSLESQPGELIAKRLRERGVELHAGSLLEHLVGDKDLEGCELRNSRSLRSRAPVDPALPTGSRVRGDRQPVHANLIEFRNSRLEGVVTDHERCAATLLGVGIGLAPDLSWLRTAGVEVGTGVKANEFLETNVSDIYVAGDIAEFFDAIVSRQLQIGNWMNAMSQGRTVARSMMGERTSFRLVSSYATNVLGLEVIFVGDVERAAAERVHIVGSVEKGGISQVFERDGRVVGGALIGRNRDRTPITKAIQEGQSFSSLNLL